VRLKVHRSISFLLRLPFAIFISWLWIDTHHRWVALAFDYQGGTFYLASWHGELWVQHFQFKDGKSNGYPTGVIVDRIPDNPDEDGPPTWFPSDAFRDLPEESDDSTARGGAVAHWLVLTIYFAAWIGHWAWQRKQSLRLQQEASGSFPTDNS
jgi:hypothetical protein